MMQAYRDSKSSLIAANLYDDRGGDRDGRVVLCLSFCPPVSSRVMSVHIGQSPAELSPNCSILRSYARHPYPVTDQVAIHRSPDESAPNRSRSAGITGHVRAEYAPTRETLDLGTFSVRHTTLGGELPGSRQVPEPLRECCAHRINGAVR